MKEIRYCKLHFRLVMNEDTTLPKHKASALRGGMGEMLLRMHCIRDRNCENCDFEPECLVRRTMYSKMEIRPGFMSRGDSVGYVLECEDEQTEFRAGDELRFQLLLFGKTIVYFSQFLQAFYQLGVHGLGKEKSRFQIVQITNTMGDDILRGTEVAMEQVKVMDVSDYIQYRRERMEADRFYDSELMQLIEDDFVGRNSALVFEDVEYLIVSVGTSYEPIVLNVNLLKPERILFLYTEKSERTLGKIIDYCKIRPEHYEKSLVNETDPMDVYREIKRIYFKWNQPARLYID